MLRGIIAGILSGGSCHAPAPLYLCGVTSEEEIRLMLVLHYDGSGFFGWQIQPERRTVQGVLQAAAARLTQRECTVTGSGRTDRGVHATGQVASLTVPGSWTAADFRKSANAVLPDDVWIQEARQVPRDFHPRYDAVKRTYLYRLGLSQSARSPFHRPFCWPVDRAVDRSLLDRCADAISGERSFRAFAKSGQPQRGTHCRVYQAGWRDWLGLGHSFTITADRYLHHMVRYLVGTMVAVGTGKRTVEEFTTLLETGPTEDLWTSPPAPAEGLFLHRVEYRDDALRSVNSSAGRGSDSDAESREGLKTRPSTSETTTSGFAGRADDGPGDILPKES